MWRDTALEPTIFGVDARVVFPVAIFLFHWSWTTFTISLIGIAASILMRIFYVSLADLTRMFGGWLISGVRVTSRSPRIKIRNCKSLFLPVDYIE